MHLYNFFVCGPKFTRFPLSNLGGLVVDQLYFSDFWRAHPFRRYSRSKSKVVRNRAEIRTFLALPNFRGWAFQKLYARYHPCLATRRLEKFHEDIPTSPEVIGTHTLNFKPIFKFSRLQFFWGGGGGGPSPGVLCASKAWSISRACKLWGRSTL